MSVVSRKYGLGSHTVWVQIFALPLPSCVAWGGHATALCLSFPLYEMGII